MAHIVMMGAGIGGMPATYEIAHSPAQRASHHGRQHGGLLPVHPVQSLGRGGLA